MCGFFANSAIILQSIFNIYKSEKVLCCTS